MGLALLITFNQENCYGKSRLDSYEARRVEGVPY